jgi:hypothetical protein
MLVNRLISGSAALLRWAAEVLESRIGDNTGVISGTSQEAENDYVPAQDPVTPEARALLRGECAHGMTKDCATCSYEGKHGPGAQSPPPPDDAVPADRYFSAKPARRVFRP